MEVQCADGNKSSAHSGDDGQMVSSLIQMSLVICVCVCGCGCCVLQREELLGYMYMYGEL